MDAHRFDRLTRLLSTMPSRRRVLLALALCAAPLSGLDRDVVEAGPGCRNVDRKCKRDGQCCSGICKGKKGKKRCRGHGAWGCKVGQSGCDGPFSACIIDGREDGVCFTTTGNAAYCADTTVIHPCTRDADCRPLCGPRAACVQCANSPTGTLCGGPGGCAV